MCVYLFCWGVGAAFWRAALSAFEIHELVHFFIVPTLAAGVQPLVLFLFSQVARERCDRERVYMARGSLLADAKAQILLERHGEEVSARHFFRERRINALLSKQLCNMSHTIWISIEWSWKVIFWENIVRKPIIGWWVVYLKIPIGTSS